MFFLLGGGGRGSPRRREGRRGSVFIENPRRGVLQDRRGREAGRVSAADWGISGGLNIFFFGAEMSTKITD